MPTPPTPITPLPTPIPITSDPADFDARADATWTALPDTITGIGDAAEVTYANAVEAAASASAAASSEIVAAAAIASTNYAASSASSLSLTAGAKTIVLDQAGKSFAAGDIAAAIRRSNPNQRMFMTITAWDSNRTMTASVASDNILGSGGPFTDWIIVLAIWATPGAVAADVWAGDSTYLAVTTAALTSSAAFGTLTDASTVAWDIATQGFNARVTITANRLIGAPTGLQDGLTYSLVVVENGAGGWTPTWASIWDFGAVGAPAFNTGAGKANRVWAQYDATSAKLIVSAWKPA
jgi:hypothetical protein